MNKDKKVKQPKEKSVQQLNRSRRLRHGTMATVLSVCFVAAVVLVNVIVSILVDRYPISVDLTSNKVFELSQESIDYVENIDKDIDVYILATKEDFSGTHNFAATYADHLANARRYSAALDSRGIK